MSAIRVVIQIIATTVPGILIAGGMIFLGLMTLPIGVDPTTGWKLIGIGVGLYVLELFVYVFVAR